MNKTIPLKVSTDIVLPQTAPVYFIAIYFSTGTKYFCDRGEVEYNGHTWLHAIRNVSINSNTPRSAQFELSNVTQQLNNELDVNDPIKTSVQIYRSAGEPPFSSADMITELDGIIISIPNILGWVRITATTRKTINSVINLSLSDSELEYAPRVGEVIAGGGESVRVI